MDFGEVAKLLEGHARISGAEVVGIVGQIPGEEDTSVIGTPGWMTRTMSNTRLAQLAVNVL